MSWTDRTEFYNNLRFDVAVFGSNDFGGNKTWQGYFFRGNIELPTFHWFSLMYAYNPYSISTRSTRGGPAMLDPIGREWDVNIGTDSRKSVAATLYAFSYLGGGGEQFESSLVIEYKPSPNILLSIGPDFSRNLSQAQWVGSYVDPTATETYGSRYVFADFDQKTLSANIRLNWTFSPQLSLQLFVQPLLSSGDYRGFKQLARSRTFDFAIYGKDGSSIISDEKERGTASRYTVDADGAGPAPEYSFGNPNFSIASLRGNAVLRWEYRPGSALYLVWTQSRSDYEDIGEFRLNHSMNRLWSIRPDNIFMLKFTYWWSP
jgi:hypothetical protein